MQEITQSPRRVGEGEFKDTRSHCMLRKLAYAWVLRIIWFKADFAVKLTIRLVAFDFQLFAYSSLHFTSLYLARHLNF